MYKIDDFCYSLEFLPSEVLINFELYVNYAFIYGTKEKNLRVQKATNRLICERFLSCECLKLNASLAFSKQSMSKK